MEKYIQRGEYLLNFYEDSGGIKPKPKELDRRAKLLAQGKAEIVKSSDWWKNSTKRKIVRKR